MTVEIELETIKQKIGKLLFLYPELKFAHPNERLIAYWKYYDQFGEVALVPHLITNYHSIDRAFRMMLPENYKNKEAEKEWRLTFGKSKI